MVSLKDFEEIRGALRAKKAELHLYDEVKWSKVTENYLTKYESLMRCFFPTSGREGCACASCFARPGTS